jgi:hypothetical protein
MESHEAGFSRFPTLFGKFFGISPFPQPLWVNFF